MRPRALHGRVLSSLLALGLASTILALACSDSAERAREGEEDDASAPTEAGADFDAAPAMLDAVPPPPSEAGLDAGPPRLIEHLVKPKDADGTVTTFLEDHYAYLDTRVATQAPLVLWLTGASGVPAGEAKLLRELAGLGFHAIGLRYVNNYLIVDLCAADPDVDCHGKLREEALDGQDHSKHIAVPPENSIEVRLGKLLTHLDKAFPAEGWGSFLSGQSGLPNWKSVIVGGTSHGASATGRISKVRELGGAIMASGPFDNRAGTPAAWTKETSLTPLDKIYTFCHSADAQFAQDQLNWAAMGLLGTPTFVDGKAPDWGGSHRLESNRAGGGHGSTSSVSAYPTVWKTMLKLP